MTQTYQRRPENDELFASLSASATVDVGCSPDAAWALITDVTRIGEFSPECVHAEWLDGATGPVVGARFLGTNRIGDFDWARPCTVTACDRPARFGYVVGDRYDESPASEWRFDITPTDSGCRVTQTFRHVPDGLSGLRHQADADVNDASTIIAARLDMLSTGMRRTLDVMKAALES